MKTQIAAAVAALAFTALPAFADGYQNAPPPNKGPDPLSPQTSYHPPQGETVRVVRVENVPQACGCCCGTVSYGHSWRSEPVVIRQYSRTYTRVAAPSCYTTSYVTSGRHHGHGDHHWRGGDHRGHRSHHGDYRSGYTSSRSYRGGPVYEENSVIWSSGGSSSYVPARYPSRGAHGQYQPQHPNDRGDAWAHYDHGWKRKTNTN